MDLQILQFLTLRLIAPNEVEASLIPFLNNAEGGFVRREEIMVDPRFALEDFDCRGHEQ